MKIEKSAIETGEPTITGHYACFLHGLGIPTVIRFWCVGQGWLSNLKEPVAGTVAGWIGPLPVWAENALQPAPSSVDQYADKPLDFDL